MMAIGKQIKLMERVPTNMQMAPAILVSGSKTNSMAGVLRPGRTEPGMKGCIVRARRMDKVLSILPTEAFTQEISFKMRYKGSESTTGQMERPTKVSGKLIKCMAEDLLSGKTASATMGSLKMTCAMVRAASNGGMAASMKDPG